MVEGCTIVGVREGIVTHMSMVDVTHNHIGATTPARDHDGRDVDGHAITHNDVLGAHGVGIICLDHSECEIEHNTVVGTRTDATGDPRAPASRSRRTTSRRRRSKNNTIIASPGGVAGVRPRRRSTR